MTFVWPWIALGFFVAIVVLVVVALGRRAWALLRGDEEAVAGDSWGRQATTSTDKKAD